MSKRPRLSRVTTPLRFSLETHKSILRLINDIQRVHRDSNEFRDKLEAIDKAMFKYKIKASESSDSDCKKDTAEDILVAPLVASEAETISAELINIFVNRYPLFPVLGTEGKGTEATQMELLIDNIAKKEGWARQLTLFLSSAARYNVQAIEISRVKRSDVQITPSQSTTDVSKFKSNTVESDSIALKTLDMYNSFWDTRVPPADVSKRGEFFGYNEVISATELKSLGNKLATSNQAYNLDKAYKSTYRECGIIINQRPKINEYTNPRNSNNQTWAEWLGEDRQDMIMKDSDYIKTVIYLRIIPKDHKFQSSTNATSPQVWKFIVINNLHIIHFSKITTIDDRIPIFLSDLKEDGFNLSTLSAAERMIPFQTIVTELMETNLQASRRSIADRAIYDPTLLSEAQVNSANPSAKMPIKNSLASSDRAKDLRLSDAYYAIPFNDTVSAQSMQHINTVMSFKDQVNGLNAAARGQYTPGNRTRGEFDTLKAKSQGKVSPMAILLSAQVFDPLKELLKLFILMSDIPEKKLYDPSKDTHIPVNITELRSAMLEFKVLDGLKPKEAIRDPQVLQYALNFISGQQLLPPQIGLGMFSDMLAIYGIDFSKYLSMLQASPPQQSQQAAQPQPNSSANQANQDNQNTQQGQ